MDLDAQHRLIDRELNLFQQQLGRLINPAWPLDVRFALQHIHSNLFDPGLTVGQTLTTCGLHGHSFFSHFKRHCRTTVRRYIEDLRMLIAMRLLSFEGLEIGMAAVQIGYSGHSTFARAFKRCVGCTPTVFKESSGKDKHVPQQMNRVAFRHLVKSRRIA